MVIGARTTIHWVITIYSKEPVLITFNEILVINNTNEAQAENEQYAGIKRVT